jgi:MFS transporter, FSR family, fosmidomycin resistance protein
MNTSVQITTPAGDATAADTGGTRFRILGALSLSHFLNDMMQSLILALYPMLKGDFSLTFTQIGIITLTFQFTASLLQPLVGLYTDRRPQPYALSVGMGFTLVGLMVLALAPSYAFVLLAAALVGTGSAVFHPEASRMARLASGGRHGFAQSMFQVGGYAGQATGPLVAAWIILPFGRISVGAFCAAALLAIGILWTIGNWYRAQRSAAKNKTATITAHKSPLPQAMVVTTMVILITLMLTKSFYVTSLNSYLTFYLIERFSVGVQAAQMYLFALLASVTVGTMAGGLLTDRLGRRKVIWISMLGATPFTLMLPYVGLELTGVLIVLIGLIMASASPAMLVYAQDILPGRVGLVAGLFFGLAFGIGGIGAAVLGKVADVTDITYVYRICSFIPLLGLLALFLPNIEGKRG